MSSLLKQIDPENYALVKVKDVLELLECPVCMEHMSPPIYQCKEGHPFCSNCKNKLKSSCPICRCIFIGDIRSSPFEKLITMLHFTCKYNKLGCLEHFPHEARLQHEQNCVFRPYDCPYPYSLCMTSGGIFRNSISEHMQSFHGCKIFHHPIEYEFTALTGRERFLIAHKHELLMCRHLDEDFCLFIRSESREGNANCFLYLMFFGDNSEAENFRYRVQVSNGARKSSYEGIPHSIRDGYVKVEAGEDGLIINNKAARFFSLDGAEKLRMSVTCNIWKE